MTTKELSQLYHLNREIEKDEERLARLQSKAESVTMQLEIEGHGKGNVTDRVGNIAVLIYEQKRLIVIKQERAYIEQNRLYRFISEVSDSVMRQILTYRFVNGLTWQRVAECLGEYDESYVRRKCKTFLKNLPKMSGNMC